jgi:hypothetical protein
LTLDRWFAELLGDILFVKLVEGTLFEELAKVAGDWLWCNGRIGSIPEVGFGCSGRVAVEEANDRMKSIAGGEGPIAWCDWLLGVLIAAKAL